MKDKLSPDSNVIRNAYNDQLKTLYDDFAGELLKANSDPEQPL
jgi:hypothetical protein